MGIKVNIKPRCIEVIDSGDFEPSTIVAYIHHLLKNIKEDEVKKWVREEVEKTLRRWREEDERGGIRC